MGNKGSKKKKDKGGEKKGKEPAIKPETYDFKKVDAANRIFGVDIQEALKRFNIENMKSIPPPILVLMDYIEHHVSEKQVFKKDGSKTAVNVLNYKIDTGAIKGEGDCGEDVHVVCANLKKYIRELPGGLLPYGDFALLGDIEDQNELVGKMKEAMGKMNETALFFYFRIARLLDLVVKNPENEMGIIDLTQVFRMNLMEMDPTDAAKFTDRAKAICDATIEKFSELFNPADFGGEAPKKEEEEVEGEAPAPVEPAAPVEEPPAPVEEPPAPVEEPPAPADEVVEEPPAPVDEVVEEQAPPAVEEPEAPAEAVVQEEAPPAGEEEQPPTE